MINKELSIYLRFSGRLQSGKIAPCQFLIWGFIKLNGTSGWIAMRLSELINLLFDYWAGKLRLLAHIMLEVFELYLYANSKGAYKVPPCGSHLESLNHCTLTVPF